MGETPGFKRGKERQTGKLDVIGIGFQIPERGAKGAVQREDQSEGESVIN